VTPLMQRMREELLRRNYAATTIHSYLKAVEHLRQRVGVPLDQLGPDDIRSYHAHLLGERSSWGDGNWSNTRSRDFRRPSVSLARRRRLHRPRRGSPAAVREGLLRRMSGWPTVKAKPMKAHCAALHPARSCSISRSGASLPNWRYRSRARVNQDTARSQEDHLVLQHRPKNKQTSASAALPDC